MKILIAEDETSIQQVYKLELESRGHDVKITSNGEECTTLYEKTLHELPESSEKYLRQHPPFDVVILDYRMPKMDGMDAAKIILGKNPHQRIIFASAYVASTLHESVKELQAIVELIQKPFDLDELANIVEDKQIFDELKKINVNIKALREFNPTHEQLRDLLKGLNRLHKQSPLLKV
jgi:CheY-like chemotaxis protein